MKAESTSSLANGSPAPPRGTIAASLFVIAATASGSAANFLFQWLAARQLDPDRFSLLTAMLAIITICVLPGPPLAIAIVRKLSRADREESPPRLTSARHTGIAMGAVLLTGIVLLAAGIDGDQLHLASGGGVFTWIAAAVATIAWLGVFPDLARVQASGNFRRYGRSHALLAGFRLGLGGGALLAGGNIWLVLLCLAPAPIIVRLLVRPKVRSESQLPGPWFRELFPVLAATGGLHALVTLDVIFARAHFGVTTPELAGAYAACAVLARALFHIPFAATAVTVQRTAIADARGMSHRRILGSNLALVAVLVTIGGAILFLFPEMILRIFAGDNRYQAQADLLQKLLVPTAIASFVAVPTHYLLALGSKVPAMVLGIAPGILAFWLSTAPESPSGLITQMTTVLTVSGGVLMIAAWVRGERRDGQREKDQQTE